MLLLLLPMLLLPLPMALPCSWCFCCRCVQRCPCFWYIIVQSPVMRKYIHLCKVPPPDFVFGFGW